MTRSHEAFHEDEDFDSVSINNLTVINDSSEDGLLVRSRSTGKKTPITLRLWELAVEQYTNIMQNGT